MEDIGVKMITWVKLFQRLIFDDGKENAHNITFSCSSALLFRG